MSPERRELLLDALAAFLAALGMRALVQAGTYAIGVDSPALLRMAELMGEGSWDAALKTYYHPGYPAAAMLAGKVVGNVETGAFLVSLLAGSLSIVPLFLLARDVLGRPAALAAALLFAVSSHVVELQADTKTEPLFMLAFYGALWAGWKSIDGPRPAWALLAGLLASLAYLVRNEGVLVVAGLAAWHLLEIVRRRDRNSLLLALGLALLLAAWLAASAPFLLWVKGELGRWSLTAKGSGVAFAKSLAEGGRIHLDGDPLTMKTLGYFAKMNYWILLLPLALGLVTGWRAGWRGRLYLLGFAAVYYAAVLYNLRNMGYTSQRYLVPAYGLWLAFTGAGIAWMALRVPERRRGLALAALALVAGLSGARNLSLQRWEDQPEREAGARIARQGGARPRVFSTSDKVLWYAKADPAPGAVTIDDVAGSCDWLAFDASERRPEWLAAVPSDPRFEEIPGDYAGGRKGQRTWKLYRVRRPPP